MLYSDYCFAVIPSHPIIIPLRLNFKELFFLYAVLRSNITNVGILAKKGTCGKI